MMNLRAQVRRLAPEPAKQVYRRVRSWLADVRRPAQMKCRVRNVEVILGTSSASEEMRATTYETKEPETLDWIDEYLSAGSVLFDIGANIGVYSLYAAKRRPDAVIYAFEPESQNFSRLCRNVVLNNVSNLVPCGFPLADRSKVDLFYVHTLEAGDSLHSFGRESDFREQGRAAALRQAALSTTIDSLLDYGIPAPNLIKLDVDGIEGPILDGGSRALASESLRSILVEWNFKNDSEIPDLEKRLARFGLQLLRKSQWLAENFGFKSVNLIFAKR
jgi:FkbM family methyltransferase